MHHAPVWLSIIAEMRKAEVDVVLTALRRISSDLENRSLRRGALQALAISGVDEPTLLLFSGHVLVSTLRRYLAWGAIGSEKKDKMINAATVLHGSGTPEPANTETVVNTIPVFDIRGYPPGRKHGELLCWGGGSPHNRWLEFLGSECPPTEELPGFTAPLDDELPLSSKAVLPSADTATLHAMASDAELKTLAADTFRWLYDEQRYEDLLKQPRRRRNAKCSLSMTDCNLQLSLGKYTLPRLSRSEIRSWCRIFSVPERAKNRRRDICEPLLNDAFRSTPTIRFASKEVRHQILASMKGGYDV